MKQNCRSLRPSFGHILRKSNTCKSWSRSLAPLGTCFSVCPARHTSSTVSLFLQPPPSSNLADVEAAGLLRFLRHFKCLITYQAEVGVEAWSRRWAWLKVLALGCSGWWQGYKGQILTIPAVSMQDAYHMDWLRPYPAEDNSILIKCQVSLDGIAASLHLTNWARCVMTVC